MNLDPIPEEYTYEVTNQRLEDNYLIHMDAAIIIDGYRYIYRLYPDGFDFYGKELLEKPEPTTGMGLFSQLYQQSTSSSQSRIFYNHIPILMDVWDEHNRLVRSLREADQ